MKFGQLPFLDKDKDYKVETFHPRTKKAVLSELGI